MGKSARRTAHRAVAHRDQVSDRGTVRTAPPEQVPQRDTASVGDAAVDPAGQEGDAWAQRVAEHRSRQASVATILEGLAGPLSACRPHLWSKRAWWMLIGLIYERLASDAEGISTGELLTMARVLTESAEGSERKRSGRGKSRRARDAALPDVVRRLYGIELRDGRAGVEKSGERRQETEEQVTR